MSISSDFLFLTCYLLISTGDSRYRVRTLSSHDVTAATLVIQPLDVAESDYPVKFVTLFSVRDELFQYQLDTVINQETVHDQDQLDGIIWLRTPPANTSFTREVNTMSKNHDIELVTAFATYDQFSTFFFGCRQLAAK